MGVQPCEGVLVTDSPATTYARAVGSWTPIDWWKLEARAVHDSPELRRALAPFAPPEAWRDLAKGTATPWGCLLTLSHIAALTLPVLASAMLVGWLLSSRDDPAPVGTAGLLAAIGAMLVGIGMIDDLRGTVGVDPKIGRLLGAMHLVPSGVGTLIAVPAIATANADGAIGIVGLLVDVAVGVAHFVFYRGPAESGSARWRRNLSRLDRALAELGPADRARMEADVRGAVDVLAARALVDEAHLARAGGATLGTLGLTMAPRQDRGLGTDGARSDSA
ncbi:hypothetical protein [Agromyces sp. Marseille-Q5079]|uniref:hypothetical protein n=1 Tax=Agromyces sp. Marseille-Q5079 TaxID=3439059 RepID=UPI003D9CB809